MEKKKNNSTSVVLTIVGVATLLVALVGATFAYFTASSTSSEQTVDAGKLEVVSTLGDTSQTNIMPTTWDSATISNNDSNDNIAKFTLNVDGGATDVRGAVYDLSITGAVNTTTVNNGVAEQGGDNSDVKYQLVKYGEVKATGDFTNLTAKSILTGQTLTGSTSDKYTLYVYILEDNTNQDKLQGATVSVRMTANAYTPKISG